MTYTNVMTMAYTQYTQALRILVQYVIRSVVNMNRNELQKAVDQIGEVGVIQYLPKGMKLHDCPIHGKFLSHYKDSNPLCPLCNTATNDGNGVNATDAEVAIDIRDALQAAMRNSPPLILAE